MDLTGHESDQGHRHRPRWRRLSQGTGELGGEGAWGP